MSYCTVKGATTGQGQTMLETIARVRPTLYQRSAFWHSPAVCSLPAAAAAEGGFTTSINTSSTTLGASMSLDANLVLTAALGSVPAGALLEVFWLADGVWEPVASMDALSALDGKPLDGDAGLSINPWSEYGPAGRRLAEGTVVSADVLCGGHRAETCALCPFSDGTINGAFYGAGWCNGDCSWDAANNNCVTQYPTGDCTDPKNGKKCMATCGFCDDKDDDDKVKDGGCWDVWDNKKCKKKKDKCDSKKEVAENCMETCGFCDDKGDGCMDVWDNKKCKKKKDKCISKKEVAENCRETCGFCRMRENDKGCMDV